MSTKFFTNEEGRTLLEKIAGIFAHKNIHFFDVLVGYFRASGYFRIRPFVQRSGKIRILVGINVDRLVQEAWDKGLQFGANLTVARAEFLEELKQSIQKSAYDRAVEEVSPCVTKRWWCGLGARSRRRLMGTMPVRRSCSST